MSTPDTGALNQRRGFAIAEACVAGGVRHAVLSPGARNTPLVLALHTLSQMGAELTLHSVLDERSAAFFGLGLSRITGRPTLLSCTSGSAGAHYLPAILEAEHSGLGLIAITADRPEELHSRGAPQTLRQTDFFGRHVRSSFDLGTPSAATDDRWVSGIIAQALDAARAGPVHINAPFRKPLWDADAPTLPRPSPVQIHRAPAQPTPEMAQRFAAQLTGRGIIVAGPDTAAPVHADAALALANRLGWPILADPLSALRFGNPGPVVQHHDAFLRNDALAESLQPETILHLGATPSSKPLMKLLGAADNVLSVSEDGRWRDPWHSLDALFAVDIQAMVNAVADTLLHQARPEWVGRWMSLDETVGGLITEACTDSWWEGAIAHQLVAQLPTHALLHVASSMPIRDLDGFGPGRSTPLRVVANRGLNGIDGLISTAAGEAHGWTDGPTVLLVGDLGFLHDVGSLSTLGTPTSPLVIVVVDNGGGGLFAHLPIGEHRTAFEPWFLTPHHSDITGLATGAGLEAVAVSDLSSLSTALDVALARPGFSIIHAPVDRKHSLSEHHAFWARIANLCAP